MRLLLAHADDQVRRTYASAFPADVVVEVASAGEALRAQRWCGELQAAIVHGRLSDMDAPTLVERLRQSQPNLPVVAVAWPSGASLPSQSTQLPDQVAAETLLSAVDELGVLLIPVEPGSSVRRGALQVAFPYCPPPIDSEGLVIVANEDGKVVFLNGAAQRVFDVDDVSDLSLSDLSADWAPPFPKAVPDWQAQLIVPGGRSVVACQTYSTVADHDDGPRTVISARPLATHCPRLGEVLASENRFRILLEELRVGVVVQDKDDRIIVSNPMACELLGITKDQLHGKSSFDPDWHVIREDGTLFKPEEHPSVVAVATKRPVREVVMGVYRPKTRDRVWILVTAEPVLDERGDCERVIVTFSDISKYKAVKDKLQRAHRLESIGTLAAGLAHDFNNILSTIMAAGESMLMSATSDEARELAQDVFLAAERGALLTQKLRTFGRERAGRPEAIVVDRAITELIPLLRRIVGRAIRFDVQLTAGDSAVWIDSTEFERALLNLVVNARDVQPEGGRVSIETRLSSAESEPAALEITVSDEGPGIPKDIQDRIFEPMFSTKGAEGTGLGLATVYGAVTGAGGSVNFETSSEGTTFSMHLPVTTVAGRPQEPARRVAPKSGATILVVDDDALLLDQIRRLLEDSGYRVLTAGSGEEAWRAVQEHRGELGLVLTDVVMPGLSGLTLHEKIRREFAMPVLLMSGHSFADARKSLGAAGFPVVLSKPITRAQLLETVRSALA